ncbi:short-chain dehydrogenase/reductase SDR [Kribbella flavida DSM 17836]|uniref:Short-chain dehydrogenase/reductase SDR n=1 Tax=Kribbella flavida (strain DSM 17836 / JCM 10339 / NBRC 14399) TaxID=479435 RepID=D2Q4H1_KRIFD|nr:SDR family NAD(P)-dependent oxidoreductase [Kribbella flavida]ADB32285.1 short-chain dehydrogenase/reductase SDR [Kribbella flavida DSM 17836]
MPGVVVIGAGPGIGRAVGRRFAREGLPVALIARRRPDADWADLTLAADSTDETALRTALDKAVAELGTPDVLVYNAAKIASDRIGELSLREHQEAWAVNVGGAMTAAAHVAPAMVANGGGSFLITGGMPETKPDYVSLSLGKAGVRALVSLLDQTYGADGLHAATVTVHGQVAPGTAFDPDDIAEHYWTLHRQPQDEWKFEVHHTGIV